MKRFIEEYKGFKIYFEDGSESTAPTTNWLVETPSGVTFWYDGNKSLDEIREIVNRLTGSYTNTC